MLTSTKGLNRQHCKFEKNLTYDFIPWFAGINKVSQHNNVFGPRKPTSSYFAWAFLNFDFLVILVNGLEDETKHIICVLCHLYCDKRQRNGSLLIALKIRRRWSISHRYGSFLKHSKTFADELSHDYAKV